MLTTIKLLTPEEKNLLIKFKEERRTIVDEITRKKLMDNLIKIINSSSVYSFKNNKTKKYLSLKKPVIILKINKTNIKKFKTDSNKFSESILSSFKKEILIPYTKFILNEIDTNKNLKKYKDIKEPENAIFSLGSTMFDIYLDDNNQIVYIGYNI